VNYSNLRLAPLTNNQSNKQYSNNGSRGRRPSSRPRSGRQENNPSTLYGAPPTALAPLAEYGAAAPPLSSYGLNDALPSYGNRRSRQASNIVPVYIPGPSGYQNGGPLYAYHNV